MLFSVYRFTTIFKTRQTYILMLEDNCLWNKKKRLEKCCRTSFMDLQKKNQAKHNFRINLNLAI